MFITLMFSVDTMKSRTFSSLPYSAEEQVCRSWEGTKPGSQPKLASGNVPYHRCHAQFKNGGWLKGRRHLCASSFHERESSLVWEFILFLGKFRIAGFCDHCLGTDCGSVLRW